MLICFHSGGPRPLSDPLKYVVESDAILGGTEEWTRRRGLA